MNAPQARPQRLPYPEPPPGHFRPPQDTSGAIPTHPEDRTGHVRPLSEPFRALGWHLAITALCVLIVFAIFGFGVIAVLNLGTGPGIAITLLLAICAIGVASWWINGKGRPQA